MAERYGHAEAWRFCRVCRPLVEDARDGVTLPLCADCLAIANGPPHRTPIIEEEFAVNWVIDQECWKLESLVDGPYRLTKKKIADVSEATAGPVLVTEDDLVDLAKVLAARSTLDD